MSQKVCDHCEVVFEARPRQRFCARKCAMAWHNSRQVWSERADRELHNSRKRARYWEDPAAGAHKMREWRARNPELQKEITRRTRLKNEETIKQGNAAWRDRNRQNLRDRANWLHYQTRKETPWKHILRSAFRRALEKGLPFTLTPEWAASNWTGRCNLTDIPFDLTVTKTDFYSPSIDRIVPKLGYVADNCRFVLHAVNSFKSNGTDSDMLRVCRTLLERAAAQVISPKA